MSDKKYIGGLIQSGKLYKIIGKAFKYEDFTSDQLEELKGEDGNGIESIEQTTTSTESGGKNIITVTTTSGDEYNFNIYNGQEGEGVDADYYDNQYLTFEALEDATFKFSSSVYYSIDSGNTWIKLAANTESPTITEGSKIMWKGTLTPQSYNGIGTFTATGNFNAMGNPSSLLVGDDFESCTDLTNYISAFCNLFTDNSKLLNAKNIALPATTLSENCYSSMFYGCSNLLTTPKLRALKMETGCYSYMFSACTSLTEAPELPSTELAKECYTGMFNLDENIVKVPDLPAVILTEACYASMFAECAITTPPEMKAKILAKECCDGMFQDCKNLVIAPDLLGINAEEKCYQDMFRYCESLKYIKCLTLGLDETNLADWVKDVPTDGIFISHIACDLSTGNSGIPEGWTSYKEYSIPTTT